MKRLRLSLRMPTTLASRWIARSRFDAITVVILLLVGSAGIAATVALLVKWAPGWLAETKGLKPPESAQELGRVRTALLAMTAGAIAIVGLIYTARTFSLNRQSQITERLTRAVDQLGNQQIDIRLGGIYALERIAQESVPDHRSIMEILTGFLREHSAGTGGDLRPATDIEAALGVVAQRSPEHDGSRPLSFRDVDLHGGKFYATTLIGADFWEANLTNANLERSNLSQAKFTTANLSSAWVEGANLQRASFLWANLTETRFHNANLEGAKFLGAELKNTRLRGANLRGADFSDATLTEVDLTDAEFDETTTWPDSFSPFETDGGSQT